MRYTYRNTDEGSTMIHGQTIHYTIDNLGAVDPDSPKRGFVDHNIMSGDEGTYVGPHPSLSDEEGGGWHITTIEVDGRTLMVPVHLSMIEEGGS